MLPKLRDASPRTINAMTARDIEEIARLQRILENLKQRNDDIINQGKDIRTKSRNFAEVLRKNTPLKHPPLKKLGLLSLEEQREIMQESNTSKRLAKLKVKKDQQYKDLIEAEDQFLRVKNGENIFVHTIDFEKQQSKRSQVKHQTNDLRPTSAYSVPPPKAQKEIAKWIAKKKRFASHLAARNFNAKQLGGIPWFWTGDEPIEPPLDAEIFGDINEDNYNDQDKR
ncbi:MAG: hypothetical protein EZS28_015975, partial [Streblomastix strix]